MRMARGLDLSEEQRESFKALADEHRQAMEPLWQKHRELRQEMRKQLDAGNADAQAVGQLAIDAHQVAQQMAESRRQVKEKFEALLTPDQKTKLKEFESRRGKRGPRGFFGPGRRGPAPPDDEDGPESES
jgi:Spy/CpxP family protein refolding chaperone